jgi:hypothetical protein
VVELLEPEDRAELRLTGFGVLGKAGLEVAVASRSRDCEVPHQGQNLAPDSISLPHDEQWMDESLATRRLGYRGRVTGNRGKKESGDRVIGRSESQQSRSAR